MDANVDFKNIYLRHSLDFFCHQIQEPVKFTEQLEEEIRAKACRAPRSILGDVKPSGISAIHTQQSEFVFQEGE